MKDSVVENSNSRDKSAYLSEEDDVSSFTSSRPKVSFEEQTKIEDQAA
jgi:hypothetical protein